MLGVVYPSSAGSLSVVRALQLEVALAAGDLRAKPVGLPADPHLVGVGLVVENHPRERQTRGPEGRPGGVATQRPRVSGHGATDRRGARGSRIAGGAGGLGVEGAFHGQSTSVFGHTP